MSFLLGVTLTIAVFAAISSGILALVFRAKFARAFAAMYLIGILGFAVLFFF